MKKLILFASITLVSCSQPTKTPHTQPQAQLPTQTERTPANQQIDRFKLWVPQVTSADDFKALALPAEGMIRQGQTIKFLIDNRVPKKPMVYFMNANYCKDKSGKCETRPEVATFHFQFGNHEIKGFPTRYDDYTAQAYYNTKMTDRKWFDGRIQEMIFSQNGQDVKVYALLFLERDLIHNELVQQAVNALLPVFKPGGQLYFVQNSQEQNIDRIKPWLAQNGVGETTMEQIMSTVNFIGLNPGTALGYLRWMSKEKMKDREAAADLEPNEIPVFEEIPLELAVVKGVITTTYQDLGSHVNLKSMERGTPNMILRNQAELERLRALDGKPVKLEVSFQGFTITEVDREVVDKAHRETLTGKWDSPSYVDEKKIVTFDSMCTKEGPAHCLDLANRYGGKSSGLGFLADRHVVGMRSPLQTALKYRLTPMGFAVPLSHYKRFVEHNRKKDPEFGKKLDELVNTEMGKNDLAPLPTPAKKKLIREIKELFLQGEIPPELYTETANAVKALKATVKEQYKIDLAKVKVRSSANTEDIKGFNGAGLHDSYSAKVDQAEKLDNQELNCHYEIDKDEDTGLEEEDVKPKNLGCAIKGAYASIWNLSAVRERSHRRFKHDEATMGVSILPIYKFRGKPISANSVLVTRVIGTVAIYGQQLSTQVGNGLVTNPVAGTRAELATLTYEANTRNIAINIIQYAKPKADAELLKQPVMTKDQMLMHSKIAREVEIAYCKARKKDYFPFPEDCRYIVNSVKKPSALDMEFKTFADGQILLKQARLFNGK